MRTAVTTGEAAEAVSSEFGPAIERLAAERSPDDYLHCPALWAGRPAAGRELCSATHLADFYEFILVRGPRSQGLAIPSGTYKLTRDHLVVIEPGVEHGEYALHEEMPEAPGDGLFWFMIHGFTATAAKVRTGLDMRVDLLGTSDLTYIPQAIGRELSGRDLHWQTCVHSLLRHLSCILMRRLERESFVHEADTRLHELRRTEPRGWRLVQSVLGYCAAHYRERGVASAAAEQVGYSRSHVSRLFAKYTGTSIADHVSDLRLAQARHLLSNTDIPTVRVADTAGYQHYSNFRRAFKAATGHSPREFRKAVAEGERGRGRSAR